MLRSFKKSLCPLLVVWFAIAGIEQGFAFSLIGPKEVWQIPSVGYYDNDIGGPRNRGDEYRVNTPILTYAFDPSFLDYFGTNGVKAVDQAMALFNKLPKVSKASANLSEFLTDDAARSNERAGAVNLIDLKSATLSILLEHMGLLGERYVFNLRERQVPAGSPPPCTFNYTTVIRNFDAVTFAPSRYVNGTTYTYEIFDSCPAPPGGEAIEFTVDPNDFPYSAVASFFDSPQTGRYFINLSRDDMGGLRYLYDQKKNLNEEPLPTNAFSTVSGPWQPVDPFATNSLGTNTVAVRGGIEKIRYKKVKFTTPFGTQFRPIVQSYKLQRMTGSGFRSEMVRRLVDTPDILFTAADLAPASPSANPFPIPQMTRRSNIFINDNPNPDVGPGVIIPQTVITYNKLGPFFQQTTPSFIFEEASAGFLWGSFDGTTNDPIVYPQGTTIRDIEDLVFRAF